jgi:hypothetical protein
MIITVACKTYIQEGMGKDINRFHLIGISTEIWEKITEPFS